MFKKNLSILLSVLMMAISLCACQLARPDGLAVEKGDHLVGVYITCEYLDLYDPFPGIPFENDDDDWRKSKSYYDQIVYTEDDPYNGRIYAALKEDEYGFEEYVFEGLDGIPLFTFFIPSDYEYDDGWRRSYDNAVSDSMFSHSEHDNSIEGTVYVTRDSSGIVYAFYINPVYQGSDGRVYLTSGMGCGGLGSTTFKETYTFVENGKTIEESFKVTVNVVEKDPTANINLIQMSAENTPILQEEYTDLTLPKSITLDPNTEYLIIETRTPSVIGEELTREILSRNDEYFIFYKVRGDGPFFQKAIILEEMEVSLLWEE